MTSVTEQYEDLPRFPDGRIDYTHAHSAPIVACVIEHAGKTLIAKRSESVGHHKNKWDVITGYVDDPSKSEIEHTIIELEEELGISEKDIKNIKILKSFDYIDEFSGKHLLVFAVLITMKSQPSIKLNHENIDFKWITSKEAEKYDLPQLGLKVIRLAGQK
jgi:8-oxo-dGTP pyrophosphatase MutT (NUDIX family)